jgi:NADPH:quinone reductase-like Zn-dependent oxidoreductase
LQAFAVGENPLSVLWQPGNKTALAEMRFMRAAVYKSYGAPDVLKIEDVEQPSIQGAGNDRVLIKVHSASINAHDYLYRKGYFPARLSNGFLRPRQQILGIDLAGTVEAVGKDANGFEIGNHVFGNCLGSHAEYVLARRSRISLIPDNLTFSEAAAIPTAALTALQALRDVAQVRKGQNVLINGASGGVGHFAVQFAKFYEAEVTAVCSTSNLPWVKDLGAQEVIDYTREDFTQNGVKYDVILDAVPSRTFFSCKRSLNDTGVYITENPFRPDVPLAQVLLSLLVGEKRIKVAPITKPSDKDLDFIRELVEAGKLRPVIEACYPLDQIAAAHRHVENGHAKGKVVVQIQNRQFPLEIRRPVEQTVSRDKPTSSKGEAK